MNYDEIELAWKPAGPRTPGLGQVYSYLKARGVTPEYAEELGFHIIPAHALVTRAMGARFEQTNPGFRDNRLAIVIPHRPHSQWWCARLVDVDFIPPTERMGWESMVEKTSRRAKMFAPPGRAPDAYLVPTLDWGKIQEGARVHIHESAIKAANGARLGYWSVGLNGVWGWSSKKTGQSLAPALLGLPWRKLKLVPVIVYDSNYEDNSQVQAAAEKLAERLMTLTGRKAEIMHVPKGPDGADRGFDDYCVQEGNDAACAWLDAGGIEAELDPVRLAVIELNERVCLVESLARVAELDTGVLMSRHDFCDVVYANRTIYDLVTEKVVSIPKVWMSSPWQTRVRALAYEPGQDRVTDEGDLNLWHGLGVQPKEGDVKPWLDLIADSVPAPHARKLVQWFAYPLQNLGSKMNTALLLFGPSGTGKDALIHPLKKVYGQENSVEVGGVNLKSSFNSLYSNKQLVHANELQRSFDSQDAVNQTLKMLVTSQFISVNRKGQPEYTVRNCANLVITSNYSDCVKMDEDDRRLYIHEWRGTHRGPEHQSYWNRYFAWADSAGGPGALLSYLLGVDLTGFDPSAWADETEAKEFMRGALRSPVEEWVWALRENADKALGTHFLGYCLLTAEELARVFNLTHGGAPVSSVKMGKACFKILEKTPRMRLEGKEDLPQSYWIVREHHKSWATSALVKRHNGRPK